MEKITIVDRVEILKGKKLPEEFYPIERKAYKSFLLRYLKKHQSFGRVRKEILHFSRIFNTLKKYTAT
jgi:hypothetical protein